MFTECEAFHMVCGLFWNPSKSLHTNHHNLTSPAQKASTSAPSVCSELTGITAQKSSPEKTCTRSFKALIETEGEFQQAAACSCCWQRGPISPAVNAAIAVCGKPEQWWKKWITRQPAACRGSLVQRNISWFYYCTLCSDHPGNAAERGRPPNCSHPGGYDVTAATGYDVTAANKLPQIFFCVFWVCLVFVC